MKKFTFLFVFALLANLIIGSAAFGQITQVTGSPQSATTTSTTLTITRPSGLAVGDVMIVNIVQSDDNGANGGDLSNATSSDPNWKLVAGNQTGIAGSSGDEWWGTLFYKVATASDVSAVNFSFTLDAQSEDGSGAIMAFRGVDITGGVTETGAAGGPFDVDPGSLYENVVSDQTLNANAITTATANAAVIMCGVLGDNVNLSAWSTTNPGLLTEIYELPFNTSNNIDLGSGSAWATKAATGSTGGGTATIAGGNNVYNGALLIALKAFVAPASVTINPPALSISTILVGGNLNLTATRNWDPSWTGGNGNFTYTWSSTGPAALAFTSNPNTITGTSSATNATGFSVAGIYTIICTVQEQGGGLTKASLSKTVNVLAAAPTVANLWATSSDGTQISHFVVSSGTYFSGPNNDFAPTFGGDGGTTSTAALGKSAAPNAATGHFYYLPNTSNNSGSINIYGATYDGSTINVVGNVDANGAGGGSLGFVRLAMGIDGRGWILAGDGSTVYLSKFTPGATPTAGSATTSTEDVDGVTLVGGSAATFQNGDICLSGNGTIFALANNGSGVTQIFRGTPNGNSTILTKVFDLVDNTGVPFSGRVNGVAFDLLGSLYISTDLGLFFIDQNTVNGPAGTVACILVQSQPGLQDLASNVWPTQSTLPVKLGTFNVTKQGNNAMIDWTTLTEINSDYFEIERSKDGINFVSAGTKQAAGNSAAAVNYQFIDPITINSGILYYRLKSVDLDGKSTYSKIVTLRLSASIVKNFNVYPNPFSSDLKVELKSSKETTITIRISNAAGQLVVSRKAVLQTGDNTVVLSSELSTLKSGMYMMEVVTEEGKLTQKIIRR